MNASNPDTTPCCGGKSAFLPLTILALSFALIMGSEVYNTKAQRDLLINGVVQRKPAVQQSLQVQSGLQKLAMDLLDAAKDDNDAKKIIAKYNIQVSGNPVVAPAASPSK